MTIPVSTWVDASVEGEEGSREMCFFLGEQHQQNPPKPTNELVYFKERPAMTVFTRYSSILMLFYYSAPLQSDAIVTS